MLISASEKTTPTEASAAARDGKLKTETRTNKAVTMEPFIGTFLDRIVTANLSLSSGLMMLIQSQKPRPLLPANSVISLAHISTRQIFVPTQICCPVAVKFMFALDQ
jgi:hypothetical protein